MRDRRFARPLTLLGLFLLLVVAAPQAAFAPPSILFGPNIQVGDPGPAGRRQSDPSVAVNPNNPDNMVVVYRQVDPELFSVSCYFANSLDGGSTWHVGGTLPLQKKDSLCDQPSAAADSEGNFYLAYKDLYSLGPVSVVVDLLVARSTDGGATFPSVSVALRHGSNSKTYHNQIYPVKGYLAVDTHAGSPFHGTLYLGFTNENADPDPRIMAVTSRDEGTGWSKPQIVSPPVGIDVDEMYQDNSFPVIAPDGTAYLFFSEWKSEEGENSGPLSIRYAKSTDGGRTWQPQADVASNLVSPGKLRIKNGDSGWPSPPAIGMFMTSYPVAATTPNGSIYVAWTDFPDGSCVFPFHCDNADVRLSVSTNGGATWSPPAKVSDDSGSADQFNPWIAAHPDGTVSLSWADRRLDADNINYDVFYTQTTDGVAFLPNVRISTATSLVGTSRYAGEYSGMVATSSRVLPVWTDLRSGGVNTNIFVVQGQSAP